MNLLTPEKVKQGLAEMKDGLSFCLSLPLNYPGEALLNPRRKPPQIKPTSLRGKEHRRDKGLVDGTALLGTSAPPFPLPEVGPRPPDTAGRLRGLRAAHGHVPFRFRG